MKLKVPPFTIRDDGLYQLGSDYLFKSVLRGYDIETKVCALCPAGELLIKSGFIWNGASGTVTTPPALMPTAGHDCLCELIELGLLPESARLPSDYSYRDALKTWQVPLWRRSLHFKGLRWLGPLWRRAVSQTPRNDHRLGSAF